MEISIIPDAISSIAYSTQSLTFASSVLNRPHKVLSVSDSDQQLQAQASPFCIIAGAPPTRTISRPRLRRTRRVKRKTRSCDDDDKGADYWVFGGDFLDGEGYVGNFGGDGGGFRGGGGKGWNFGGGYGGANWEESSSEDDPAFDFVYGVLSLIAMSNCLCFSVKKVVRRGKVAVSLGSAC